MTTSPSPEARNAVPYTTSPTVPNGTPASIIFVAQLIINIKTFSAMKKSTFILLAAMLASGALKAQNPDTVSFRQLGDVFCNIWYDTCACFLNGDAINSSNLTVRLTDPSVIVTIPYNVNHPMLVKGVVMMEAIASDLMYRWDDSNHLPEYALIYQHDAEKDTMILIDSARWDTIKQPKVLGLPLTVSRPDSLYYCHAFPVYFNNPVLVDSTFYVGGTHNSNAGSGGIWTYRPVKYVAMGFWSGGSGCITQRPKYYCQDYGWYSATSLSTSFPFGGFVPIVEMSDLHGETADSTLSIAQPHGASTKRIRLRDIGYGLTASLKSWRTPCARQRLLRVFADWCRKRTSGMRSNGTGTWKRTRRSGRS